MSSFKALYRGVCYACEEPIVPGQLAEFVKVSFMIGADDAIQHVVCPDPASKIRKGEVVCPDCFLIHRVGECW